MNEETKKITYEIQRFPMIGDGQGGFTLYNLADHKGQKWGFMDVSVTKRVNDCLVDEAASVENITNIREADRALQAFEAALPNADVIDHLEGLADYGIPEHILQNEEIRNGKAIIGRFCMNCIKSKSYFPVMVEILTPPLVKPKRSFNPLPVPVFSLLEKAETLDRKTPLG